MLMLCYLSNPFKHDSPKNELKRKPVKNIYGTNSFLFKLQNNTVTVIGNNKWYRLIGVH